MPSKEQRPEGLEARREAQRLFRKKLRVAPATASGMGLNQKREPGKAGRIYSSRRQRCRKAGPKSESIKEPPAGGGAAWRRAQKGDARGMAFQLEST